MKMSAHESGAQGRLRRAATPGKVVGSRVVRSRAFAAAGLLFGALTFLGAQTATAEEVRLATPANASQARGTTFVASVSRFYTTEVQGHTLYFLVFHVEHVYAGASHGTPGEDPRPGDGRPNEIVEPGVDLAVYQQIDGLNSLHAGARYFVSTADIDTPVVGNSAVWAVHGDRLSWVQMSPVPGSGDPRFAKVDTLAEAIALMVRDLPPTDAQPPTSDDNTALLMLVAGVFGLAAGTRIRTKPSQAP